MKLRQSFTDFIFATNTNGSGKAASYVRALDMLGPILAKHYPNPIIGGSMWHGFSFAGILRASHISPWAEDEKNRPASIPKTACASPQPTMPRSTATSFPLTNTTVLSFRRKSKTITPTRRQGPTSSTAKGKPCRCLQSFCRHSRCLKSIGSWWECRLWYNTMVASSRKVNTNDTL